MQKKIDASIANCDQLGSYGERAFELRKVLDEIRERTKAPEAKTADVKVAGRLFLEDKVVAGGYQVTLISASDKKFSTPIQKDGSFAFKMPIPVGEYRVAIEPLPKGKGKGPTLPPRYQSAATSGLTIIVVTGSQTVELKMVK